MSTGEALLSQWLEDTGRHMLDSGGAYGRNWERNQGKTLADYMEAPEVICSDWGVSINTLSYLTKHLDYTKQSEALTETFRAWVDTRPRGEAYYNTPNSFEDWLELEAERDGSIENVDSFNTYNWENLLDSTLQGVTFERGGAYFVALSYHGGCDVRGGYTDLIVYAACECWLFGISEAYLQCEGDDCGVSFDIQGGAYVENVEGTDHEIELDKPCPDCGTAFTGSSLNCWGW